MTHAEIVRNFDNALEHGWIYVCYQPQYNHSTGRMIGAEALMRWNDPTYGPLGPVDFIPVLEQNNLIHKADLYVVERICIFLRKCIDCKMNIVPISFNISRFDLYDHDYVEEIEEIRKKYNIPVRYLRAEITESSTIGGMELIVATLEKLHAYGYFVEMDDFGSGYSSLNVLKDLPVDMIKLDMRFLRGELDGRGGLIISSVVQMANWLNTQTIAEGVETVEQADFMKSIGCSYIQGYLYAKPMKEEEFLRMLEESNLEPVIPAVTLIETMDAEKFWSPKSLETLIFSNYVGAAAILCYQGGRLDILRVNEKYIKEVGMSLSQEDIVHADPWKTIDEENRRIYEATIQRAIKSGEEESCETWRTIESKCCGSEKICVRTDLRVLGRAGEQFFIYAMVQNITAQKNRFSEIAASERRFRFASEQANVYAWEYTIGTRQMRPCFRCMRDLGLPPLVENYPEPAIEAGIFPADYADMYRDWHRQLEEGVGSLEAIIPLTVGRIPFHVRYTTEFDENGRPLKAYGSATLVVDQ